MVPNDIFIRVCGKLCWAKEHTGKGFRDTAQYTKRNEYAELYWEARGCQVSDKCTYHVLWRWDHFSMGIVQPAVYIT